MVNQPMSESSDFFTEKPDKAHKPGVWRWKGQDDSHPDVRSKFFVVRNVPTTMRDGVVLRGDLYLPGRGVFTQLDKYASTFHLRASVMGAEDLDGVEQPTNLPIPAAVASVLGAEEIPSDIVDDDDSDSGSDGELYPCVLVRTPYNKLRTDPDLRHPALYWVHHGYTCFIQDCRGRFESDGEFYKYVNEAEDGYDTIEWLAAQPWSNSRVCTLGTSYLAHVQSAAACLNPPSLVAMFIVKGAFFDAFTSGIRQGGALEARQWLWAIKHSSADKSAIEQWLRSYPFKQGSSPLHHQPNYARYMFDYARDQRLYSKEFWARPGLDVRSSLDKWSRAPTVIVSGWYDIYARCAVEMFEAVRHSGDRPVGHTKLIMGPWMHSSSSNHVAGEVDFGVASSYSLMFEPSKLTVVRRWFDEFAFEHDEKNVDGLSVSQQALESSRPPLSSSMPPVVYYRMGGGEGHLTARGCMYHGGAWMAATQFPPQEVRPLRFGLQGRKLRMMRGGPSNKCAKLAATFSRVNGVDEPVRSPADFKQVDYAEYDFDPADPVPTIGGNVLPFSRVLLAGAFNQVERGDHFLCKAPGMPLTARRDIVVFRTGPLDCDLDVTGTPKLTLFVSSSAPDTDFTAMLVDEYPPSEDFPQGFAMNVTHGIQRCSARSSSHATRVDLLEKGKVYKIIITMYPTSNLFARGHNLALYVSSSNYPHFDVNPNTGGPACGGPSSRLNVATNRVWMRPTFPSFLELPVLPSDLSPPNPVTFVPIVVPKYTDEDDDDDDEEDSGDEDEEPVVVNQEEE